MKKNLFIILILITSFLFSEEDDKTISIDQERSETLLYGIDSEVQELIAKLTTDKIPGFDKELTSLLGESYDDSIKIAILNYFTELEIAEGESEALKVFDLIEYEDEYSDKFAVAAIDYLSDIASNKAIKKIPDILLTDNSKIVIAALNLIGNNEVISLENKLLIMLDDEDTEEIIYLEVIKTLGEVKSQKALEQLIPVLDDTDEETTVRNAVCYSLGEIGNTKAIPALKRALENRTNYLLRKSALEALGKFPGSDMDQVLIGSLRDPNWQIRFAACRALAERKVEKAFPILKYKALKDPEAKIQKEAFKAIGDINSEECREFLKEVFVDDSYSDTNKLLAIDKLIEFNIDWIFPSIEELYKEKNKETRKPILDATLKLLSQSEYKYGSELYGKMLGHENYLYKVFAIQAIKLNNYIEHKEQIIKLSEDDKNKNVKKHALSALESFE